TGGAGTGGAGTGGAGTGGASTGGAGPRILSIDFLGGMTSSGGGAAVVPAPAMTASEVAGFKPVANWNSAAGYMGMLSSLKLSDASATSATMTWNSPPTGANPGIWRNRFTDAPGNTRMMNGYLDPTSTSMPATVTVSALPTTVTSAGYDVYVYALGDVSSGTTRTYIYAIGTASFTVTMGSPGASFSGFMLAPPGGAGNYVVFRNLRSTSFTLTATPSVMGTPRAPVNGIQIVSPTGS
ncbi:MAG: hypothetical protein H7X95_03990, partial [Deltaproteobacteria bacterium]|nr:hypothetical protein [Deltaproteobacteria bacterium]